MRVVHEQLMLVRALRTAGLPLVAGLAVVLVTGAGVPAGTALLVGAVVSRVTTSSGSGLLTAVLVPLAAFGLVVFAGHLADALAKPLEFAAHARIDGTHRTRVLELATSVPSIGPLENAAVQRLIRRTAAEPDHAVITPGDGALAQLRWLTRLVGAAAACAVVARYAWWPIPLLLVPAAISVYLHTRQYFAAVRALDGATKEELHADVWRNAASSSAEGKDVRIFGFADWMVGRMQHHIDVGNAPFWRHVSRRARTSWLHFGLALVGLLPVYLLVTMAAAGGATTVAVQTAVLVAAWSLFDSVGSSGGIYQIVGGAKVLDAFERLRARLEPELAGATPARAPEFGAGPPAVRFDGVGFAYPDTDTAVLDGLDLEIRPGELLAVVGLNGAGKSTLIKLLAGLYTPDRGRVTADGTDIAALGWDAWRHKIAVVFQDFIRYQLSALDNVTLGQAAVPPDLAAAEAAAAEAGFDEVLGRLPDGWHTPLARSRTGGVDLSGGQWQQVVLTRALYAIRRGARLLVLDEPTAHLDVRTEFEVFHRIAANRGDTSVVLISHRLSTVREADRIVLLERGRISETGTHDELMALDGSYAGLFRVQAERFRQDRDEPTAEEVAR